MPQENMNLKKIEQRAQQYFYEDGLAELGVGLFFVLVGLFVFVMSTVAPGTPWGAVMGVGMAVVIIGGTLVMNRVVRTVKQRITYPRTGYVSYQKKSSPTRWIVVAVAIGLAMFVMYTPFEWAKRMPLVVGLLMAFIFTLIGLQVGVRRLYVAGWAAALLGVATAVAGLDEVAGAGITFGGVGVVMIVGGALALTRYLSANPTPEGE